MKTKIIDTLKFITYISLLIVILVYIYYEHENIINFYYDTITKERENIKIENNTYAKENGYGYVELTDNFIVTNKEQFKNIYYTIINSGNDEFTFFCDHEYENCINDFLKISSRDFLSNINNFIHPYNSFSSITPSYTQSGKITLKIEKNYNEDEIKYIDNEIDKIITNLKLNNKTTNEKIRLFHNYIIDNTDYDEKYKKYHNSAYLLLKDKKAVCSGYADIMSIFLNKINIPNYKIATKDHVWNLVYIDKQWRHLDLTWDDPINIDEKNLNRYKYLFYLIDNTRLSNLDSDKHTFDKEIYQEAK